VSCCWYCGNEPDGIVEILDVAVSPNPIRLACCDYHADLVVESINKPPVARNVTATFARFEESQKEEEMPTIETESVSPLVVADEASRKWREGQLKKLGFANAYALSLDATIDLGLARKLIATGCDPETAGRIL
jgi:hypothetical protein